MTKNSQINALLLSAGLGTRLKPLTNNWPKCLMPIGDRALLEYWLQTLHINNIKKVLVNLHHLSPVVADFLHRPRFTYWVDSVYEAELLGTAKTLTNNLDFFKEKTTLLIHADNWCQCDFSAFINYHQYQRPQHCLITMMTFDTDTPETCGIVETDQQGVVVNYHEKVASPPGNRANGAVYLLQPEVLKWLSEHPEISDFSTQVLPHYLNQIATWHNTNIHRDIGTLTSLCKAQSDPQPISCWSGHDAWSTQFDSNPLHQIISQAINPQQLEAAS